MYNQAVKQMRPGMLRGFGGGILALLWLAAACAPTGSTVVSSPSETPDSAGNFTANFATTGPTPVGTLTPTSSPSATPVATLDPAEIDLRGRYALSQVISFSIPIGYWVELFPDRVYISDQSNNTFFELIFDPEAANAPEALQAFAEDAADICETASLGEPIPASIAGQEGYSLELSGRSQMGELVSGQLGLFTGSRGSFYALGASFYQGEDIWSTRERFIFEAVLESIIFLDPQLIEVECPVATDASYGYDPANPIRVGGMSFAGRSHAFMYLRHLQGPNGEFVSYERVDRQEHSGQMLSVIRLTSGYFEGERIVYLDEATFEPLRAPAGFTCEGIFPIIDS